MFTDAKAIADHLIAKKTVVLNLETASSENKRRIIDFLVGVAYANGGSLKPVANLTYIITDQTELKDDALKKRVKELSATYRDTDKIEEIINITYRIEGGELTTAEVEKTAEMIKVDGQWYCNMGDRAMTEQ